MIMKKMDDNDTRTVGEKKETPVHRLRSAGKRERGIAPSAFGLQRFNVCHPSTLGVHLRAFL
jgi:hypothetical protein